MRTRTETRTRPLDKTVGDKTHTIPEDYDVHVPVVPRDWDAIALSGVRTATTVAVLGVMAWGTASIGDLLSRVAPSWVAYTVAGVFDLAWIVCMILEWLARDEPDRASVPRKAGWAALAVSMSLIGLHGYVLDRVDGVESALSIGIGGALVAAIIKSLWSVVMGFTAIKLSVEDQRWLAAERAEVSTELAMTAARRRLAKTRARIHAERLALGQDIRLELDTTPLLSEVRPVSQDTRDAVEVHLSRVMDIPQDMLSRPVVQDRTPEVRVDLDRTGHGQDTETDTDTRQDRTGQDTDVHVRPRTVVPIGQASSVQSHVLSLLDTTPDMDGTAIRASVRDKFPNASESGMAKAITRARNTIRQSNGIKEAGR